MELQHVIERGMRLLPESSWRPVLQMSVDAFYAGQHDEGITTCLILLNDPGLPAEIRELTYRNQTHYARALADIFDGVELRPAIAPAPPDWPIIEISHVAIEDRLLVHLRATAPTGPEDGVVDALIALDEALETQSVTTIGDDTGMSPRLRDIRLFLQDQTLQATALLNPESASGHTLAAVLAFDGASWSDIVTLGPRAGNFANGWTSLATAEGTRFLSWFEPTEIWRRDPAGECERIALRMAPHLAERFVAASQGVPISGGVLLLINESVHFDDRELVLARFVRLDEGFQIDAVSPQFWVSDRGQDRICGLARRADVLQIGVIHGGRASLASVPLDAVIARLIPVDAPGKQSQSSTE